MRTPAELCARIYALETRLIQTDDALKAERARSAILARTCDAWARAFGTRRELRAAALARQELESFAAWSDRLAGADVEESYRA